MRQTTLKSNKTRVLAWRESISNSKITVKHHTQRLSEVISLRAKQIQEKSKMMKKRQKQGSLGINVKTKFLTEKRPNGRKHAHIFL